MSYKKKFHSWLLGGVILSVFYASSYIFACPIPVFQFSLENWEMDNYQIEIRHDGDFNDEHQELVDMLMEVKGAEGANIQLVWRDYSKASISPPEDMVLPHMEVRFPTMTGIRTTLWEGPLEREIVEQLLHSPLRQEIAERLLNRQAGVWVLLKSGDRDKDREVEQFLEKELKRLEDTLKVPDPGEEYGFDLGEIYTDINFSLVTLDRDEPDEKMFIRMLLRSERDLEEYSDKPMVFPIYGRGLIMYALIGRGINEWTVSSAGEFLVGPCSCTIKSSNPGVDILMTFDWPTQVEQKSTYPTPDSPDAGQFLENKD